MLIEQHANIESKIRSSQFSYPDVVKMKILLVVTLPSFYNFLIWCVWPSGSWMAVFILLSYINLHNILLVVYFVMSTMTNIVCVLKPFCFTQEKFLNERKIQKLWIPFFDYSFNLISIIPLLFQALRVRFGSNIWNFLSMSESITSYMSLRNVVTFCLVLVCFSYLSICLLGF